MGGRQVAEAALLSRAPRIYAAATAAAGCSPTGCRSPLPRHARQAVVVGVRVTLTMVHPLWLARRPPSGCRLPLCRRLLPALAAASPWRRALPARPGRPGSLAESLPPLARSPAQVPVCGGPGAVVLRGHERSREGGDVPLHNPQRGRGWRGRRATGGWGGPLQGVWHHRRGATATPAQCLAAQGDAGKCSQMPSRCAELAPRSPRPRRRLEPGWPRSHPRTAQWCHSRRGCAHTRAGPTAHPHAGDTRTTTASPRGAWQPLPVLDGLPAAAGGKARFLGRALLNRADTAAIGRVEVSCQATAWELPAASEGVHGVTEAEGQTLACLADGHRSPERPGH